jgi:3-hydroxyacyl-CoA dehydrogenase/enoyl-CoA hydratase/carnithine racemase
MSAADPATQPATRTATDVPEEVVTRALLRYVELPLGAGTAALITLDNGRDHTRPSTFGAAGLASLDAAIDEVAAHTGLVAVALTGKPFIFAVGADLTGAARATTREDALTIARTGHAVFRRLGELSIPSFAFINGAAMGGGLEVALHCTYRTLSTSAAAVSLPECFIGLVPGWGGTFLVPNLVGAANAVTLIIDNPLSQNRQLKPKDALELGIVDRLFEPADFIAQSLAFAARVVTGAEQVTRPEVDRSEETWAEAIAAARETVEAKFHGAAPAPIRAVELLEAARSRTRDEGFAAEDDALADLLMTDELRASLYSFDLVQRRAKRPAGAPDKALARPITKVGVVGAGLMAGQLALLFARRLQVPVVLTDLDQERVDKGVAAVHAEVDKLLKKRRVSPDEANRLKASVTGTTDKAQFADADFVIEAVFEEMKVKQQVFAELEAVVAETCVLATNTSSLSVTEMSEGLEHPERVVGFHFFNPVAQMPLLEIARTPQTDDPTLATAFAVAKELKKSAVLVKDAPGFVVNRLLTRFMGEVNAAIDEGTPIEVADQALNPLGLPMTPMLLLQLVGPAVALHVAETLHDAFPDRFGVSPNLARLVAAGRTTVLTWGEAGLVVDPEVAALYEVGSTPSTAEQVRTRAIEALAREVRLMLDEGVVAQPQDLDLCMLLGAGWPFHLGGITPFLDRSGAAERVAGGRFLPVGVASVPG